MHTCVRTIALVLGLATLTACSGKLSSNDAEAVAKTPGASVDAEKDTELVIPVQAEYPTRGSISGYFETNTSIEAERHVDVTAEGLGKCDKILVEEGAHVNAGDILARLDTEEITASLHQAEIQVKQQQANLARTKKMHDEGLASDAELDNAQFGCDQTKAALEMQRIKLKNMDIRAPIDGVITRRNIQVGMLVTSGSPVFTIVDPDSFVLTINPPENQLQQLSVGQVAKVTVDSISGEEFSAKVRRINPNVDQGHLKVTLDIEKSAKEKLREGAFARVRLVMSTRKNALLVPKDAIVEENARKYLFLAKNEEPSGAVAQSAANDTAPQAGAATAALPNPKTAKPASAPASDSPEAKSRMVAERVEVEAGLEDNGLVEIVSGLKEGDRVIVRGQQTLKPKSPINVTTEERELKAKANVSAEEALAAAETKRKAGAKAIPERQRRRF